MRIITWNMRKATSASVAWKIVSDLNPDIALLQEVSGLPAHIKEYYDIKIYSAVGKKGKPQKFSTAILTKGEIIGELSLSSEYEWVNHEIEYFKGNLVSCIVHPLRYPSLNIVSVYSPAWPVDTNKYHGIDIEPVKLRQSPKVWVFDILYAALKNAHLGDIPWVVGGDFNSSETFDLTFGSGNRESLDRMETLGFTECLRKYNGALTPTFRNPKDGKRIHQMDHLFVSDSLYSNLKSCTIGDELTVFGESISDHLPIIADFFV